MLHDRFSFFLSTYQQGLRWWRGAPLYKVMGLYIGTPPKRRTKKTGLIFPSHNHFSMLQKYYARYTCTGNLGQCHAKYFFSFGNLSIPSFWLMPCFLAKSFALMYSERIFILSSFLIREKINYAMIIGDTLLLLIAVIILGNKKNQPYARNPKFFLKKS